MSLKIIFAGTPDFAIPTLRALLNSPHEVIAVYTQPDRPAGRGRKIQMSPVKQLALEAHIAVEQPRNLLDKENVRKLARYQPDLMVVVAYGLLLPQTVLDIPQYGCVNVHASLLPRWRGAAPIQHAILAGDEKTGVTIMQMVEVLDAGGMLVAAEILISPDDTSQSLHDRLAKMGANLLLQTLPKIGAGNITLEPQDLDKVTYASKINKVDACINWHKPAVEIARQVRAYYGWPVAYSNFQGKLLRIWQALALDKQSDARPGSMYLANHDRVEVVCGQGVLELQRVQFAGGRTIAIKDFINAQGAEIRAGNLILE